MRILLTIVFTFLFSVSAQAAFVDGKNAQGGFKDGSPDNSATVAQVKNMRDDAHVTLVGKIVQRLDHDKYLFRDGTGEITVEIDDEDFGGQTVTPQNTVRIYGEVDKEFGRGTEVDVKRLQVLQ